MLPPTLACILRALAPPDTAPCATRNAYGLRLRPTAAVESARSGVVAAAQSVAPRAAGGGGGGAAAPLARATTPAAAAAELIVSSQAVTGGVPEVRPVKALNINLNDVEVPEHVDDDLAGKSDYVKAAVRLISERRWEMS